MTAPAPRGQGTRWQGVASTVFLLVGLLAVVYLALVLVVGRTTPRQLVVGGTDVSRLSHERAHRTLQEEADRLDREPMTVVVDGRPHRIAASELGLGHDVDASLEGTTGRTWDPRDLWVRATGEVHRDWVVTVDESRLRERLGRLSQEVGTPARDASVRLEGTETVVTEARTGRGLDVRGTAEAVGDAWPATRRVDARIREQRPAVTTRQVREFADRVLGPALSGPVTLVATPDAAEPSPDPTASPSGDAPQEDAPPHEQPVVLSREVLASMLSVGGEGGRPSLEVDASRWVEELDAGHPLADRPARDARLVTAGEGARVEPGRAGRQVSVGDVEKAVRDAVRAQERRAPVGVHVVQPAKDGQGWRTDRMGTFTTRLPGGQENAARTHNIRTLARQLDGTVVAAGDQFSLVRVMGEPTEEKGYREAHVISDGTLSNAVGGGLSQVSTAVYNVAFEAGVQLDEHKPHSYYIARYPEGREATLWYPSIDNRWTNDTPAPVLLRTRVEGQDLTLTLYGVRQYDVESTTRERQHVVEPRKYWSNSSTCISQHGVKGFDVTVERRLEPVQGFDGPARTETVDTHYEPSDEVWCTNPASPEFSGSTVPPSWDYRPFSERKADKAQDARDRAEREARADQQAEQEAAEQDGRPEGGASPSPSSSPSGEPGAGPSPSAG
ncbi:VanW family protein [Kytococcus schroeteri]|uniref:VanW family protein n=1 Tax=Kytococcus schroeteri TaxID=138300 RepID=UPI0035EE99AE